MTELKGTSYWKRHCSLENKTFLEDTSDFVPQYGGSRRVLFDLANTVSGYAHLQGITGIKHRLVTIPTPGSSLNSRQLKDIVPF